jgi:hypothetical protein
LEWSRQRDTLIDLDRGFGANLLCDTKETLCFGILAGDLNDPIFLGGAAAYDTIFEKNICHGVSGSPAQKLIVMLGGHLDHYLHGERLLRKGVKDKAIELWRFVEQQGASASTPPVTKAVRFDARHRQRELNYDGVRREIANIQNAMW